jgi:hypothetical protein
MAFPAVTNVDGSNPGPQSAVLPDTVQIPIGNLWKVGTFAISLTPAALDAAPDIDEQTFVGTAATADATHYFPAIGLLTTDRVMVMCPGAQTAECGILSARVSAADTLAISFLSVVGTPTPVAGTAAAPYYVTVFRQQPNWTAPASGNQIDW